MYSVSASLCSTDTNDVLAVPKPKQDHNCQATDDNIGEPCGETEGLRILDKFRKLYESRIEQIDRESDSESDRVSMKLQIMSDWIKDLGEQNIMLVHTVEDLEQAASNKVKLLEDKLKQSSQMMDNFTRSNQSEEALNSLSNRVSQLEKDEKYLQQKIEYLQSDIRGLLEVIRRARRQNVWSLEGITFFEIQPEDIPIPLDCQVELERKIEDLKTELLVKDETMKKYVSRLQCFYEKLKEHTKQSNQVNTCPMIASDQDCEIILTPDILESVLNAKDMENKNLRRQLQNVESKLMICTYENNIGRNTLQLQLEEKCKKVQQLEDKLTCLEKETAETRDTLTTEIATLEKQNYHASIGNMLKDDLIREMRKELQQATLEDTPSRKVCNDTNNCLEKYPLTDTSHSRKDEFILFLNSTKIHVQKECEILTDLKCELEKFMKKLAVTNNDINDCAMSTSCTNKNIFCETGISDKLVNCIEIITRMYSEREKEISLFDCMIKKEENQCECKDSKNLKSSARQFKLMDEFRMCTVEAQAATEDIREEINTVVSTFNSRHQSYEELSKMVTNVQNYLTRTREGLIETINTVELQEEERLKYSDKIINSKFKLKDLKNKINHAESELSRCIKSMQENTQERNECGYTGVYVNNDSLNTIMEEVEQIVTNLQLFHTLGDCMTSELKGLRSQLCAIDYSLKDLQKKASEVLLNNEIAKTIFCERESKLAKFEEEIDCAHTKMQDVLETFLSTKQDDKEQSYHICDNQKENDIIKTKKDLHKLQKEYDDLKLNMMQQTCQMKYDERLNKWKNHVTDLENQIKKLQQEVQCKEESNKLLKNNIDFKEKQLSAFQTEIENSGRLHRKECMELKKKIVELENIIKTQTEIENELRKSLHNVANIKKSTEVANAVRADCGAESTFLCCEYPFKHENISPLFKTVEDSVQSANLAVQDLGDLLKRLIHEELLPSSFSAKSAMTLIDSLKNCRKQLDICSQELSKLKNAVYSKEKLLENLEEVIRIQRDSLTMSQAEVKDLHEKLQDKIEKQSLTIAQYEKEKNELLKQNELQSQTIGHLQNAVVEAKRSLDQMSHKTMTDLCEKDETIRRLVMCIDEIQDQYNDCFTEATNQDLLLDLQRDAIDSLQKRIRCLEYDKYLIATTMHSLYFSVLKVIQEQIHDHVKDFQELHMKVKNFSASKYTKSCAIQCYISETDNLIQLEHIKQTETEYEKLLLKLEDGEKEIKNLNDRINSSEKIIREQSYELEVLRKRLFTINQQTEENLSISEHNVALISLYDRIHSLKILLQEKSDNMVKLEADYELLKNENSILRKQNDIIEARAKDDIYQLKAKLKQTLFKLCQTEGDYQRVTDNFNKVRKQLISATKREADSQESLMIMEKDHCSKIVLLQNEASDLRDLVNKLSKELKETKSNLASKNIELCQAVDKCKCYADYLDTIRRDLEKEKEELIKAENVNCDLIKQLQEYMNDNYHLCQQKTLLEQNISTYITELQDSRKSLLELKKECHLKEQSLTYMSADLTETAVSRSELCKESQCIISCIRECLEQQKNYSETLAKNLENKHQLLMQLAFEKKALLIKIRKLKRINHLLTQKLKRPYRQVVIRSFKNSHTNGYISPSVVVRQNANTGLLSTINYTNLCKKCKTVRRTSKCGDSCWFPKMKYLTNEVRKNNQWWNETFDNTIESDSSLEENRDYGYQSSSTISTSK
ncbi:sporulation-specific protein 15-like isoform X3 [Pseudomyrmex gracilis]|uniref:sporulation-specific protein 15-like isoform X3 n=1 Tax=Pseudomyrmex gracilis TaxID=219809 RepID=UPI0009955C3B|nr:sporulation-specific protein 15-like isoform X3 [Pseudomyrmex gracilis]